MKRRYRKLFLAVLFLIVALCAAGYFILGRTASKSITLEEMCQDGTISIFGLNESSTTSDFEKTFGASYAEYMESLEAAYESGDFRSITFSFEGKKACLSAFFKNDTLQSIFIIFLDEELSEQDWKDFSDLVMDKLKTYSVSENQISRYFFHNAEIWLEFGPVDQSDYEVNDDGTTAWSGIVGEYGSKITEIRISFKRSV
jgi:hypothetical protein